MTNFSLLSERGEKMKWGVDDDSLQFLHTHDDSWNLWFSFSWCWSSSKRFCLWASDSVCSVLISETQSKCPKTWFEEDFVVTLSTCKDKSVFIFEHCLLLCNSIIRFLILSRSRRLFKRAESKHAVWCEETWRLGGAWPLSILKLLVCASDCAKPELRWWSPLVHRSLCWTFLSPWFRTGGDGDMSLPGVLGIMLSAHGDRMELEGLPILCKAACSNPVAVIPSEW